jgi:hypothetical protein
VVREKSMAPLSKKNCLPTLIALLLCLAVACVPVRFSQNQLSSPQPPATAIPQATSTAALPEGPYATRQAGIQATIEARATASPFSTALPATAVQGQPASAQEQRDGLVLEVRLPKDSYLAGEGGLAQVEIRNKGPETIFIAGNGSDLASLELLDERGRQPDVWPFSFTRNSPGPAYLQKLAPGDVLAKTLQFQVPPLEQHPLSPLYFWAETRFSRPEPDNPEGPDNIWLRLEAGPIKLNITPPDSSDYLNVDWKVDRQGWRLSVKSPKGQIPSDQFWGEIGAASSNSVCWGPLRGERPTPGEWAGSWQECSLAERSQIIARGWIATYGYVTQEFSSTLPGKDNVRQMLGLSGQEPKRDDYSSINDAQATVGFPIFALAPLLSDSTLGNVHTEKCCGKDTTETSVEQQVKLPAEHWMALTERVAPGYANAGWGVARYDQEAIPVDIHGQAGYAIQRFGWWYLDWKIRDIAFELRAPIAEFSLTELLTLARQLGEQ